MSVQQQLAFSVKVKGMRRKRNIVPGPINRLPNELLCFILTEVAQLEPPQWTMCSSELLVNKFGRNKALGFLRLSEVCRRFRALLLSIPSVWAATFRLPEEPGRLALLRAASEPLIVTIGTKLNFDGAPWGGEELAESLMDEIYVEVERLIRLAHKHASRIRSLTAANLTVDECMNIFRHELPLLQSFRLIYDEQMYEPVESGHVFVDAPNLQHACIMFQERCCPFMYHDELNIAFKLPSLRKLDVRIRDAGNNAMVKLGCIVDILSSSPLVEDLCFELYTYSVVNWDSLFENRHVRLPRLRHLSLAATEPESLHELYKHVCMSAPNPLSGFKLRLGLWTDTDIALNIVEAFGERVRSSKYNGFLMRVAPAKHGFTLEVASFPALQDPKQYSPRFLQESMDAMCISAPFPGFVGDGEEMIHALFPYIQSSQFKQLIIDSPGLGKGNWPNDIQYYTASTFTAITELLVQHPWNDADARSPLVPELGHSPALDAVFVRPVFFMTGGRDLYSWWRMLIAWLEARERDGRRVRRLHILKPEYRLGASRDGGYSRDGEMRVQAARFVDEMFDERAASSQTELQTYSVDQ